MERNYKKGFTLIELLVVIAIIGILSAVVLASLNTARQRGADAAIKSSINNARGQAELYYSDQTPNSYAGICANTNDHNITAMVDAAQNQAGSGTVVCNTSANDDSWAIGAPLRSGGWYCVDASGAAKDYDDSQATNPAVAGVCI